MNKIELELQHKIEHVFGIKNAELGEFEKLKASNFVYSFVVKKQKYVIKKLIDTSIMDWRQEKAAYDSLKAFNLTDELVFFDDGIKITKFLSDSRNLSYGESDLIDALNLLREFHQYGVSINYNYDISGNMNKYISLYDKKSKRLKELESYRDKIDGIQAMLHSLNIPRVLCHGDACVSTNFLRLSDGSIRIVDWEQAGMADPILDIAIGSLHQGFENVDPVWCLHQYLKRIPEKEEYLRLFSYLALNSFALMAWCLYENPGDYRYYLKSARKYSDMVYKFY